MSDKEVEGLGQSGEVVKYKKFVLAERKGEGGSGGGLDDGRI